MTVGGERDLRNHRGFALGSSLKAARLHQRAVQLNAERRPPNGGAAIARSTNPPPRSVLFARLAALRSEVITSSFMLVVTGRRHKPEVHNFTITASRAEMLLTARKRVCELTSTVVDWNQCSTHWGVSRGKASDRRRYQLIQLG